MLVTFEGDNLKEEDVVIRDSSGHVVKLELPEKLVMVANHQVCIIIIYGIRFIHPPGAIRCMRIGYTCGA